MRCIIKPMKKGTRCTICTGCGRCFGENEKEIKVLSVNGALNLNAQGFKKKMICADIGTTTIAMVLLDEDLNVLDSFSKVNPQGKYGADVISRIKASSGAGGSDAASDMKELVRDVLKEGVCKFARVLSDADKANTQNATPDGDSKLFPEMYIAANTTMVYLLMGYDTTELGSAPFKASHTEDEEFELDAGDVKVNCHVLPGFSAFVGSDIYAGILASGLTESEDYTLLCDLGTNGEIALGNKDKLYVTATAAGPAFEGGPLKGIWGADIVKIASYLLKEGKMDNTGLLADPYFEEGISAGNVFITQDAIRALQLAKAAMSAGIKTITESTGISYSDIKNCIIAGGFGVFLDPADASYIKLLPSELLNVTRPGGNTALTGCVSYALGKRINIKAGVINLASAPGFNDLYMNSMDF